MIEKKENKGASLLDQWKKRKKDATSTNILSPKPIDAQANASKGQERLWLLQQLYPDNAFYQYGHLYTIHGALDLGILEQSFQHLIDRHEILRSNFVKNEEKLLLDIREGHHFKIKLIDLSKSSTEQKKAQSQSIIAEESTRIFDLANDLLIRVSAIKLEENEHQLVLSMHHIIGDRWSLNLINEELFQYYRNIKNEEKVEPGPLPIQYSDFAHWQHNNKTKSNDLNYWTENLDGDLPLLELPKDHSRPTKPSFSGANTKRMLSVVLSKRIKQLSLDYEVTPFVSLLSAFKLLLYRYTNQEDIIIGSPFSNRDKIELEKLIGFFNETLVLRTEMSSDWTFEQLLTSINKTTRDAFNHKNVPFDELVKTLNVERHGTANPIFQAMFLYNSVLPFKIPDLDLRIEEEMIDLGVSKFDLTLFVNDYGDQLELSMEYALDLFDEDTIDSILENFEILLHSVVENPQWNIDQYPIISETEENKIAHIWNDTKVEYPTYIGIHEMIEEQALLHPDHIAVTYNDDKITYAQLNKRANSVAHDLIKSGVEINDFVGLYVDRSVELMIGMVGILKAGAAYLPLDPEYPRERIDYMLEDSGASTVLCQKKLATQLGSKASNIVIVEDAAQSEIPENWKRPESDIEGFAYTIYTSGSTGKPKGVPVRHKNLLHSTLSRLTFYPSNPDSFLLLSSFSFDSSVVGIFWTLCTGGKLVIPPKRIEQDVQILCDLISKQKVSHTLMLPSLYSAIINHAEIDQIDSLKNVMVAGEACPFSLIDKHYRYLPNTELYNEYGPTEASVWCVAHLILPDEKDFVPIGKPIPNAEAYIMNSSLQVCPIGVAGELYIGGLGVVDGYYKRPDLTREKFIAHPFNEGERLYKTGDMARYHKDGRIEFLGRVDHQVKIRGYRIEPDEIQNRILEFEQVDEAHVIVHESKEQNQKQLIAYVTKLSDDDIRNLRVYLAESLPSYMIPSKIISVDRFPRLPNGKMDRKKLPNPDSFSTVEKSNFIAPKTELEMLLAGIWKEILGIDSVGIHDNFFSLGGDSILSIQVVSKARDENIFLAPNHLFENQTIATLVNRIRSENLDQKKVDLQIIHEEVDIYPLSQLQNAFLFNSKSGLDDMGVLQLKFTLKGKIEKDNFEQAWQKTMERHDAMRTYIQEDTFSRPNQKIDNTAKLAWEYLDWSNETEEQQKSSLEDLIKADKAKGLNLNVAPISRMTLIQMSTDQNLLLWTCHHIFLDGWSCGVILKDALQYYHGIQQEEKIELPNIPNFLNYLKWNDEQDKNTASLFWKKTLSEFKNPQIFQNSAHGNVSFADQYLNLSTEESDVLNLYCQRNNISISTLFQGAWALLIGRFFDMADVVFGVTVSGRFVDFPQIENTSGLFMNVIPSRFKFEMTDKVAKWLTSLQEKQGEIRKFEHFSSQDIKSAIDWPIQKELFDSLFVFGNFLKDGLKEGDISVEHFEGGFSTGYPLTIRVNPLNSIEIDFRFDQSKISIDQIESVKKSFYELLINLGRLDASTSIEDLLLSLKTDSPIFKSDSRDPNSKRQKSLILPKTKTEQTLLNVWNELFHRSDISVDDNFFELGGKSLMAIQLFGEIEHKFDKVLPPSHLFQYPTIELLSKVIDGDYINLKKDNTLIALKESGNKSPLFCIHGGGAHVFFYKPLAEYLSDDMPVYSFQPPGLEDEAAFPESIGEMASQYLQTIKSVQSKGPYQILGTCFSNAVVLEMAHQLKNQGEKIDQLFIIDSAPVHLFGNSPDQKSKPLSRFFDMLKRGDFSRIKNKILGRFKKKGKEVSQKSIVKSSTDLQLEHTIQNLNKMYADYHWNPVEDSIHFIRSEEFHNRKDKNYHLTQWQKLAKGGIKLHVVPGTHLTLFEEPHVQGLAAKIDECIELNTI